MYLQLAENSYLSAKRSKEQRRAKFRQMINNPDLPAGMRKTIQKFYVPLIHKGKLFHVREDMLDGLKEDEYDYIIEQADQLAAGGYLSEPDNYLAGKAERQARRAERDRKKQQKTADNEAKRAAKTAVIQARADKKQAAGQAKLTKAQSGQKSDWWKDTLTGAADIVGAFKGTRAPEAGAESAGAEVTGAEIIGSPTATAPAKKSKTGLYIGIGAGALLLIGGAILIMSKKSKK